MLCLCVLSVCVCMCQYMVYFCVLYTYVYSFGKVVCLHIQVHGHVNNNMFMIVIAYFNDVFDAIHMFVFRCLLNDLTT